MGACVSVNAYRRHRVQGVVLTVQSISDAIDTGIIIFRKPGAGCTGRVCNVGPDARLVGDGDGLFEPKRRNDDADADEERQAKLGMCRYLGFGLKDNA